MAGYGPIIREDCDRIIEEMGVHLAALSGTTLLVTGASGFLCSYLVDVVARFNEVGSGAPCRILALDNFQSGLPQRLAHLDGRDDVTLIRHNVAEPLDIEETVDWIVHGASIASPMIYRKYPLETIDANVGGTRNMLNLARRGCRGMLVMSTSEIYGDPDPAFIPTQEDYRGHVSCTGPRACYDESKRLAETLCVTYHRQFGTRVMAIRPFNVFGPGQRLDDLRIIPDMMRAALEHRPITLFSDGRATRAFCYVTDAIRGMFFVLFQGQGGEPYNVGNDEGEISIGDMARLMVETAADPKVKVVSEVSEDADYLTDNPQRRCPNLGKLRGAFPWVPKITMAEGLARTLASYRAAGPAESLVA